MIVLIDAGNTLVKFGWLDPDTGQREARVLALDHANLAALDDWLDRLAREPAAAVGVTVAHPGLAAQLQTLFRRRRCEIRWIDSLSAAPGVRNAYDPAGQLGADRWVSLVGLSRHVAREPSARAEPALMLATFGTASTIDTLDPDDDAGRGDRVFRGGVILPGPAVMRTALAGSTALLPDAEGSVADFPTHTLQAIATGIAAAQAGALARQWLAGLDRFGLAPRVFCAGGAWPLVETEARRLLARVQRQAGVDPAPLEWLATPVLNGLAAMALDPVST